MPTARSVPSPARASYHHGDLTHALIEGAVRAIAARGADAFSMSELARGVGVDPSAVYRHFEDRAALLAAVARRGFALMADEMEHAVRREPARERRVPVLGRAYVEFAERNPALFRLMFGPLGAGRREGRFTLEGPGGGRSPYRMLLGALEDLAREGRLGHPPRRAAMTAWSVVHGLASLLVDGAWRPRDARAAVAAVDDAFDAMVRGLAAPPGGTNGA